MTDSPNSTAAGDRLAKVIARAGLCSRRDAEAWIREGRVAVNGTIVRSPAFNVTDKDKVKVDGAPLAARSGTRVWLYHKPAGLVVTEKDPEGRATIFEALAEAGLPRVVTVGRLDLNTEGLLLLTNDGGLKRVLELPATGWLRRYRVRAFGSVSQAMLDGLKDGIEVDGVKYGPIEAVLEREQGANVWLVLALREGKNREVKNVLGALGLEVNRLIRVSYGPFQLGDLPPGAVEVVKARVLRDQLGNKLAEQAGVDFDSEMPEVVAQKAAANPRQRAAAPGRAAPARPERRRAAPVRDEERPIQHRPGRGDAGPPRKPPRPSRPEGPARRILFDAEEGRAPEEFHPPVERKPREDRPERGERPERGPRGDRAERPARTGEGTKRPFGDRPARPPRGDRPERPAREDRPARTGDGPKRAFGAVRPDRPPRAGGPGRPFDSDRPARPPRGDRPDRAPRGDRPDRPASAGGPGRSVDADRPARPPRGDRPDRAPREDRPDRPARAGGPRPFDADRPARPPRGDRPDRGERPVGPPRGDKPFHKPREGQAGDRPPRREGRPQGAARPHGAARPGHASYSARDGARPGGARGPRPAGARPAGPRPPRPGGGGKPPRKPRG